MAATIWVKKNHESFSILFFCKFYFSGELFNSCKKCHGRLKAGDIFSCVKFTCEKRKNNWFSWESSGHNGLKFFFKQKLHSGVILSGIYSKIFTRHFFFGLHISMDVALTQYYVHFVGYDALNRTAVRRDEMKYLISILLTLKRTSHHLCIN